MGHVYLDLVPKGAVPSAALMEVATCSSPCALGICFSSCHRSSACLSARLLLEESPSPCAVSKVASADLSRCRSWLESST